MQFNTRSTEKLRGVHPDLVKVLAAAEVPEGIDSVIVTEGLRDPARQAALVKAGASQTLRSRHLTGHAVDLAAVVHGEVRWDWPLYDRIAKAVLAAAKRLGIPVTWGGSWRTLKDGPHFELPAINYPA